MAAAISKAFETSDMEEIIAAGLQQIPADCLYRKVFDAVERCYRNDPQDWRACLAMLQAEWGYDKYPGVCHIIPNAGVCALALYYGRATSPAPSNWPPCAAGTRTATRVTWAPFWAWP